MSEQGSPKAKRLLAEGAAIVISILLAFAIDAAWDERSERGQEREALEALASEFESAASALQAQIAVHDSAVAAAELILAATGPTAPEPDPSVFEAEIPRIIRLPNYAPPLGALDALIGSGDLRLIQNDELRSSLATFRSELSEVNRTQRYSDPVVFGQLLPLLNESIPMRRFGLLGRGDSEFTGDLGSLVRRIEFQNVVQNRLMNHQFAIGAAAGLAESIDQIRDLIDSELGR